MDSVTPISSPLEDSIRKISDKLDKHMRDDKVWKDDCEETYNKYAEHKHHDHDHHVPGYKHKEGSKMGMDNISDRVNINLPGGSDGGFGGAGMAAVIAALGNRNEGSDNAALIAALGNRNSGMDGLAPLMAMAGAGGGFGGNMNAIWPIVLLALLGRGGHGGLFGGGDGCSGGGDAINQITLNEVLSKLGTIEGQVPFVGSQVQNSILEQTNALQNTLNQNNIAQLVAQNSTKDAVTSSTAILGNQASQNTQAILQAVAAVGTKIDTNTIADLQRQLAVAQSREAEERHHARIRDVEVNVSQQVNQQQAQAQFQQQQQDILRHFSALAGQINILGNQVARTGQDVINVGGLMNGTSQTANPVNVK